jgi:hypothetical protein
MDLRSGGDSFAAVGPCSGGVVLEAPREGAGSGGDSGHTIDPVSGESRPASLAPVRGARGPVGRPREPIQMCHLLVRRPSWWGFKHRYDFDRFVVVFFLGNDNLDHIFYINDPFFSLPQTW